MNLQIFQVDAFSSNLFGGNPAAVVPLDSWLPDHVMKKIAAENNLAETAFFVKNSDEYDIRWFTPKVEIDLCGHATLASGHVVLNELKLETGAVRFRSHRSGPLSVAKQGDRLVLDFPAYGLEPIEQSDALAQAVGTVPVKIWETQGNMVMLRLENEKAVREAAPDMNALLQFPYDEVIITAPGEDCDFASRMFAPKIGIPEDPVTGAIHCSLIPYWAEELGKKELFARQVSQRGGELYCELHGDRVKIGGHAVTFLKGEIFFGEGSQQQTGRAQSL
jgi:PhzF family phenazine biosynthesis protein